ncbi:CarD family transcriptional regulator [Bacilliculturomica massiliensis]|uniref:CarD family transcriptional regulator n=1 Tax=Bacilliculturomica massiliensis TaxID=1917867 RepID=UPI00102FD9F5|nr:CarD family transcriptional regulator [Bacilliculturomica massiliensis]
MFTIGDRIVYPMHGAGVIEKIEDRKILGETRRYYVLKIPCGDMEVMIPTDNSGQIGIRSVVSEEHLTQVLDMMEEGSSVMPNNWNRRFRENMDKLKTGEIENVAEVVRNLMRVDREKKLSTGEKKMLANARQILISEIIMVKNVDQETASDMISAAV